MLTIKHVSDNGEEYVYATDHINFVPADAKACAPSESSLWRYDSTGRAFEITEGLVYVMNEGGSTVARYDMTAKNNPKIGRKFSQIGGDHTDRFPVKSAGGLIAGGDVSIR